MSSDALIDDILQSEGGYSDRAADKGGPTNMGITIPTLSKWIGAPATKQDIINLTRDEAKVIYMAWYVDPWRFIEDDDLRDLLVDWTVTSGLKHPTRALQAYITSTGAMKIEVDGALGNKTREAWKALVVMHPAGGLMPKQAHTEIASARVIFYAKVALDADVMAFMLTHPKSQLHNLIGWLNRALRSFNLGSPK